MTAGTLISNATAVVEREDRYEVTTKFHGLTVMSVIFKADVSHAKYLYVSNDDKETFVRVNNPTARNLMEADND